jgi:poly(3-hydroxyalkanoate) synthetase
VLANSGHIQSLINPPGNSKAVFWTDPAHAATAEEWLEHARKEAGSWWPHWLSWIQNRSGDKQVALNTLGGVEIPLLGEAPGQYVMEK